MPFSISPTTWYNPIPSTYEFELNILSVPSGGFVCDLSAGKGTLLLSVDCSWDSKFNYYSKFTLGLGQVLNRRLVDQYSDKYDSPSESAIEDIIPKVPDSTIGQYANTPYFTNSRIFCLFFKAKAKSGFIVKALSKYLIAS